MNRYERNLMVNITIMKILYVLTLFINLLIPIKRSTFFYVSLFQIIIVIIWFFGLLGGMGFFDQRTPILPIGVVRLIEIIYYGVIRTGFINWIALGIYIIFDIIYIAFLFFDKANYEYKSEVFEDGKLERNEF